MCGGRYKNHSWRYNIYICFVSQTRAYCDLRYKCGVSGGIKLGFGGIILVLGCINSLVLKQGLGFH
jgi:hypothetical protein